MVLAGAGSGKTRALVHRVARLLSLGVAPEKIVLCTFTQRAARELTSRVESLVGAPARAIVAGTIHGIAHRILEKYGALPRYRILDRGDADRLLADSLSEGLSKALSEGLPGAETVRSLYSRALAEQRTLEEVLRRRAPRWLDKLPALEAALDDYAQRKAAAAALDFDDLLFFCKVLLTEQRPTLGIEHVLVDEYQDVTLLQAQLLELLGGSLLVVGDEAQAIYSFRGADPRNLTGFRAAHPDAKIFHLSVNYRSTPEIIAAANRVSGKQLRAERSAGGRRPASVTVADGEEESRFVAARMAELLAEGRRASELAALYRSHAHGVVLELELARRRVPYRVRSGARFVEQAHVKDLLAWLRLSVAPRDRLAWSRVAKQLDGVGARSAALLAEAGGVLGLDCVDDRALAAALPTVARPALERLRALAPSLSPSARPEVVLQAILHKLPPSETDPPEDDLRALLRLAAAARSTADLLQTLALAPEENSDGERVTLSTVHQAKGLEWPVVFILSLVEGRFPLPPREPADLDEERRLFYVAVTRARDELYLCRPSRAESGALGPSRFLLELDGLVDRWSVVG